MTALTAPQAPCDERSAGIYIHFPWCLAKCPYCDFLSLAEPEPAKIPQEAYTTAIRRELEQRAPLLDSRPIHSVFFGGGTPSLWDPKYVKQVLETLALHYRVLPGAEITLEANPTSFDATKGEALLAAGVNRLSLGVQALSDERLEFLGRLHRTGGALDALSAAKQAGFTNFSADLIQGVYRQTPDLAVSDVEQIVNSGVSHLSAYILTVEPGTAFGALHRKGKLPLLDDALVAQSFEAVHDALSASGFTHYEISNFARDGRSSRHNLGYWRGEPYLGIGLGAYGTLPAAAPGAPTVRYRNTAQIDRYLQTDTWPGPRLDLAGALQPYHQVEEIDLATQLSERLMLGLRLREGLAVPELTATFGAEWVKRHPHVTKLQNRGKLEEVNGRLRIPYSQWLFADGILAELV
jgi:putative oxygen-independent coproporphyrinogen III oxidase